MGIQFKNKQTILNKENTPAESKNKAMSRIKIGDQKETEVKISGCTFRRLRWLAGQGEPLSIKKEGKGQYFLRCSRKFFEKYCTLVKDILMVKKDA